MEKGCFAHHRLNHWSNPPNFDNYFWLEQLSSFHLPVYPFYFWLTFYALSVYLYLSHLILSNEWRRLYDLGETTETKLTKLN